MKQCVETIRIINGRVQNIKYHNARYRRSMKELYDINTKTNLRSLIKVPIKYKNKEVKCRVIYDAKTVDITYQPYARKAIKTATIVKHDSISYPHKYIDRPILDQLLTSVSTDEIIICKNGQVTDGYYYNLVFQKGNEYFTPVTNLLPGIMRDQLLSKGKIMVRSISIEDINNYDFVHFINAFNGLGRQRVSVTEVTNSL